MLTLQVIACIGIIKGAFLLFQIRLNDFTGNIFHRLLDCSFSEYLSMRT